MLEITFSSVPGLFGMSVGEWRSVLYSLLEGASDSLDISRDDIDGALYPKAGRKISLILFDTVPGGAGGALRIARSFPLVMETALRRMARCECGAETSCYGCLRNFRNQAFHEQLRRGDALGFLERLVMLARCSMTGGGLGSRVTTGPFGMIGSHSALGEERARRAAVGDVQVVPRPRAGDEQQAPLALQILRVGERVSFGSA